MTTMLMSDIAMQHVRFRKATPGADTFGISINYFDNLFKIEESIYFFAFGYVFLEIRYFGILTSYFQIFESEALKTGIFAQHPWKPLENDGKTIFSDYRRLVLDIFENFNLLTLVSIRRNLEIYYFLGAYSYLIIKNNIRKVFVSFYAVVVEISYLNMLFCFHGHIF